MTPTGPGSNTTPQTFPLARGDVATRTPFGIVIQGAPPQAAPYTVTISPPNQTGGSAPKTPPPGNGGAALAAAQVLTVPLSMRAAEKDMAEFRRVYGRDPLLSDIKLQAAVAEGYAKNLQSRIQECWQARLQAANGQFPVRDMWIEYGDGYKKNVWHRGTILGPGKREGTFRVRYRISDPVDVMTGPWYWRTKARTVQPGEYIEVECPLDRICPINPIPTEDDWRAMMNTS